MMTKIAPLTDKIAPYLKAVAGAVVGAATYVLTVGFDAANIAWWAGLVVFLGAGFGIVWVVPNKSKPA